MGTALFRLFGRRRPLSRYRQTGLLAAFLFFSMMPDLDSIAGFVTGDLGTYHNQGAHSFFAAAVAALATAVIAGRRFGARTGAAALVFGCYAVHILMDTVTDGRGVMLGWPFTSERVQGPPLFYGLHWSEGLWSMRHLVTAGTELAFVAVLWALVFWGTRGGGRTRA